MKKKQTAVQPETAEELNREEKKSYKEIRWERLDNTAHLFPVIRGREHE